MASNDEGVLDVPPDAQSLGLCDDCGAWISVDSVYTALKVARLCV